MSNRRLGALAVFLVGVAIGWFAFAGQHNGWKPFKLGLDLSGGTQLVYKADLAAIQGSDVTDSMAALRDTIERRVNLFGVSEPIVQTQHVSAAISGASEDRLIIELPGITDTKKAIDLIGQTPVLEFRMLKPGADLSTAASTTPIATLFENAAITGKDLASAQLEFSGQGGVGSEAVVALHFNSHGAQVFADLTKKNVGKIFGIFLDGSLISAPVIRESIPNGTAVISGNFTPDGAKELARNLNYGALPVPIELLFTQTVSGTLGAAAVQDGIMAALWGIVAVVLFMLVWYRLPGLIAGLALLIYIVVTLALFQIIPVTMTAAGIAAFILSVGMAVDANVLIFERMKEEMRGGKNVGDAIHDGFARAWPSIRDSNISSMITAVILFWFGTSLIKGFALVFGLGVLISMLTAITVSRTFLMALGIHSKTNLARFLFGSGISL
ncbi:protein translocase subunit SecD [Candidatus Kaiserbacteria bacterium]|nr:protein translocase subunit SecD [Candidatus Kaiserbacteria bacterium]